MAGTTTALADVHYVDVNSTNPMPPYTNWASAATNIQDAVDAALAGDEVVVTDGVYASGGRALYGTMTNRVAVDKPLTLRSVNGPRFTIIQGQQVPGTTNGDGAMRCVYLASGASLSGFTLTNGATRAVSAVADNPTYRESSGGGVWCETTNTVVVSNCVLAANSAYNSGGGSYGGRLNNCALTGNSANGSSSYGGGAYKSTLNNCTLTGNAASYGGGASSCTLNNCALTGNSAYSGGGADGSVLNNCTLTGNAASFGGGGAYSCTLSNCTLAGNSAADGGGAYYGTLDNCTVTGNSARGYGGGASGCTLNNCALTDNSATGFYLYGSGYYSYGGGAFSGTLNNCTLSGNFAYSGAGAYSSTLNNCIIYFNRGTNFDSQSTLNYCCATPQPTKGVGNISLDPQLASAWRLSAGSPCRGAGNAAYARGSDLDGEAWLSPPSIGCDQYHAGALTGPLSVGITPSYTNVLMGYTVQLAALIEGRIAASVWDFGDGATASNQPYTSHAWTVPGDYAVVLRAYNETWPGGTSATLIVHVRNGIHYVAANSANPVAPYASWATAATNIQDAINAAEPGGPVVVMVTNGIYAPIAAWRPMALRSVNGPLFTVIDGAHYYTCAGLGNGVADGATLSGFTLTNGGYGAIGGALNNCTLSGNDNGGAYESALNNCALTGNSGVGANYSTLTNCTVTGNSGGGASGCTLNNCIVYFNTAAHGANYDSQSTLNYCCTMPQPANGVSNISLDPQLASASHLSAASPCRGAGNPASASGTDIDGEAWLSPPSVGCDENHPGAVTGPLSVGIAASFTTVGIGFTVQLTALIEGRTAASVWDFGDGITTTNQPYTSHAWTALGDYAVILRAYNESQPSGVSATVTVHVVNAVHYVAADGGNPIAPYASWGTAATNIQDAVDAATVPGALVLVTNGIYATGGRAVYGSMTNRVVVDKTLMLRSVNGPQFTIIQGHKAPGITNGIGDGAIRCVYLTNGASLSGFTLTNGATRAVADYPAYRELSGGGLWCESKNTVVVSNCVVSGNCAYSPGGGAYGGTLNNCALTGNINGGADSSILNNCTLSGNAGAGAYDSTLNNSTLTANSRAGVSGSTLHNCALSGNSGSGADSSTLSNCTLTANSGPGASSSTLNNCALTGNSGSGADSSTLNNCTVTGNSGAGASASTLFNCALTANSGGWAKFSTLNNCTVTGNPGGGAVSNHLNNCIVYFNGGTNYDSSSTLNYCCTTPLPASGLGNISSDPELASFSRLSAASPCRGAGNAAFASGTDIDGEAWLSPPSIGCDEYHAASVTGPLTVGITASLTNVLIGFTVQLTGFIGGQTTASVWDFGDGLTVSNQPYTSHSWAALGDYAVVLRAYNESWPGGISSTVIVHVVNGVHYVAANSANPVAPYTSWTTAATNIQDAINAAEPGAAVVVMNGTYAPITASGPLTLRSVNGPLFTIINGDQAKPCVTLATNATLSGFTLTNGTGGAYSGTLNNCTLTGNTGGGAHGCILNNCTLSGNSAFGSGGGASGCTLNNCVLTGNLAYGSYRYNRGGTVIYYEGYGGGAYGCTLNNCTFTGNSSGAYGCALNNCILFFNDGVNYDSSSTLNYCCTTPQPANGTGNISLDPQLASSSHLSAASPCRGAGNAAYATGADIDGESWLSPPSIGCDEYHAGSVPGPLSLDIVASYTNVTVGLTVQLTALIDGQTAASSWDFGDGVLATNQPYTSHVWTAPGEYRVVLRAYNESQPGGISGTVILHVFPGVHYVAADSANPVAPYVSWTTAASTIQQAVDVAVAGDEIVVTNGIYAADSRASGNGMTNRVVVGKPLNIRSVNGAQFTIIDGGYRVRCVSLANGASLSGFTLTHGFVQSHSFRSDGGGVVGGTLNNCIVSVNRAEGGRYRHNNYDVFIPASGGGASGCTLNNCTLEDNSAWDGGSGAGAYGGGASGCTLNNCTISGNSASSGGGAHSSTLNNCTLAGNSGGGASSSTLKNCALTGNSPSGAFGCTLTNCTLTGNSGSGAQSCSLNNCIVYFNGDPNYDSSSTLNYCCTTPPPANGMGNISVNPQLASASHLSALSPCRGAGNAVYTSGADIDGEAWLSPPAIGCDEYHAGAVRRPLSVAIAASFTNVSVDFPVQLTALIEGRTAASVWDFGDGIRATNQPYTSHGWTAPGDYAVVLRAYNVSQPGGISANVTVHVVADIHYVAADSANPVAPYTSWATAATNIQDAVNAATVTGAQVVVTNGTYAPIHAYAPYGLTVRSVKGALFTLINGAHSNLCASLADHASLSGFTLTNGAGGASGGTLNNCTLSGNSASSGGGASGCTLNNCALTGNSGSVYGGGAQYSTLNNCAVSGNSASYGGGAYGSTLNNCTLSGNSAYSGGGVVGSALNNCIIYFNTASQGVNYDSSSSLNYCCTTPQPTIGVGNISLDPQLASSSHLSASSPCRGAGNAAYAIDADIDGEPWAIPPSIGCDEFHAGAVTGPLSVNIAASFTNIVKGLSVQLTAMIEGRASGSVWDFGDGVTVSNQPYTSHSWAALGDYAVVLHAYSENQPGGVSATVTIHVVDQPTYYVAPDSPNPVAPYTSWATAATNIQDAVDAATTAGALVLVTNGIYATGGRAVYGTMTNRVAVDKPLTLQSVNGPEFTIIQGHQVPGTPTGDGAIRCVYLTNGASLTGFTLTNGSTRAVYDYPTYHESSGGGLWSESTNSVTISNCVVTGNSASYGGGAYGSTLNNCTLNGNSAPSSGGGAYNSMLNNCTLKGNSGSGASGCTLNNCTLTGNSAGYGGGGAWGCTLNNCTLTGNSGSVYGGGAQYSTLNNCALSDNSAPYGAGAYNCTLSNCTLTRNAANGSYNYGGGAYQCILDNCTLTGNSASSGGGAASSTLNNCTLNGNSASGYGGGAGGCTLTSCGLSGNSAPYGGGASGCTLTNCTLTGNSASNGYGGGAYSSTLNNCTLSANWGAGASSSTLNNCALTGNSGSGAFGCTLANCTLTGNSGSGGVSNHLNNCILYFNGATNYDSSSTLNYCCTTPLPTSGIGNISSDPQLAGFSHLSAGSPCRGAGNAGYASGADIDGEAWLSPPSIGCDEYHAGAVTGSLSVAITASFTNVTPRFAVQLTGSIEGRAAASIWDFGDGITVSNQPYTSHAWALPGDYAVVLRADNGSQPGGVSATLTVHVVPQPIHYVAAASANPVAPYTTWATAATSIQDAVDAAAIPGALVLVNNGTYASGGRAVSGTMTNRVTVDKPLNLRSVNGPQVTIIQGYTHRTGGCFPTDCISWDNMVRCVHLANGASLSGFTLTNGASGLASEASGGGLWCASTNVVVSNCVVVGNVGYESGGVYSGTLNNCTLTGNLGAGASFSTLNNCALTGNSGAGAYQCTLNNCILSSNSYSGAWFCTLTRCTLVGNSAFAGGGAQSSTLLNCALIRNSADHGGGASGCLLINCTLTDNSATSSSGGAHSSTLNNCIVYFNSAPQDANYDSSGTLNYCCTTPPPTTGIGNLTNAPPFVDQALGNPRLQSNSPCINAGNNLYVLATTDLDGNPRIAGGTVDIGAYEFQLPASTISYAWLQQYGLPIDSSTDTADPDADGVDNYHEWLAGSNPTNRFSFPPFLTIMPFGANLVFTWPTNAFGCTLQSTTNLTSPSVWSTNSPAPIVIGGQNVVTDLIRGPQQFYRLKQ